MQPAVAAARLRCDAPMPCAAEAHDDGGALSLELRMPITANAKRSVGALSTAQRRAQCAAASAVTPLRSQDLTKGCAAGRIAGRGVFLRLILGA